MRQLRYAFLALMTLALFSLNAQQVMTIRKSGTTIKVSGGAASTGGGGGGGGGGGVNLALQGFGADAAGASVGDPTITVNTLSGGTGTGSLYWALNTATGGTGSATSHKKIVFSVDGTISSNLFTLNTLSNVTLDGTGHTVVITAPANDGLSFEGSGCHHNIVKNLHFANCGGGDGANAVDGAHDIAFMNCSFYGNGDGNIDVGVDCSKITIQYCIIGNHIAPDDDGTGGMLITSIEVSCHHNLFNVKSDEEGERCPLIHGNYSDAFADVRNNIVYNFGRSNSTGSGYGTACLYGVTGAGGYARANIVNNYYYTPSSDAASSGIDVAGSPPGVPAGEAYSAGNISGNGYNFNTGSYTNHAEWSIASQYQIESELTCAAVFNVLNHVGPDTKNSTDNALIADVTQTGSCTFNNNFTIPKYPKWLPTELKPEERSITYSYEAMLPGDIISRRKKKTKSLV
jgi:hypothetical protein